jgi:hypothetical protein
MYAQQTTFVNLPLLKSPGKPTLIPDPVFAQLRCLHLDVVSYSFTSDWECPGQA